MDVRLADIYTTPDQKVSHSLIEGLKNFIDQTIPRDPEITTRNIIINPIFDAVPSNFQVEFSTLSGRLLEKYEGFRTDSWLYRFIKRYPNTVTPIANDNKGNVLTAHGDIIIAHYVLSDYVSSEVLGQLTQALHQIERELYKLPRFKSSFKFHKEAPIRGRNGYTQVFVYYFIGKQINYI